MKLRTVKEMPCGLAAINNKHAEHEELTHATMLTTTNPSELPSKQKTLCVIPDLRIRFKCMPPGYVSGPNLRTHIIHSEYTLKNA